MEIHEADELQLPATYLRLALGIDPFAKLTFHSNSILPWILFSHGGNLNDQRVRINARFAVNKHILLQALASPFQVWQVVRLNRD
jgi:hypothetical protein